MTGNVSTVNLSDGRVVTLSYGVAVAVFVPKGWGPEDPRAYIPHRDDGLDRNLSRLNPADVSTCQSRAPYGYLKTDRKYSTTSSRHAGLYARQNGSEARTVSHEVFRQLVSPVQTEA